MRVGDADKRRSDDLGLRGGGSLAVDDPEGLVVCGSRKREKCQWLWFTSFGTEIPETWKPWQLSHSPFEISVLFAKCR